MDATTEIQEFGQFELNNYKVLLWAYTIDEIAILLDMDEVQFQREIREKKTPLAKAYLKGKLESMAEIRKLTVEFAKKGSPQTEGFIKEYLEKMEGMSEN